MSDQQPGQVVALPSAGVPADQGLSSLGLVMQLASTLMALGVALFAFSTLIAVPGGRGDSLWLFLLLATCVARSLFHRMAGTELLYGRLGVSVEGKSPLIALRRYVIIGLAHSLLFALALQFKFGAGGELAFGIGLGLAVWPALLGALLLSKLFGRFATTIPVSEDKGFEGASILMTVLGTCGALATAAILLAMFESGGKALREGKMVLLVLALVMLIVRSVLHVLAGLSGLRTTSIDRSVELSNRYASFGIISAFCAGGAMLLVVMTERLDVMGLAAVTGITWMLMAWPMAIRRFFGDRQFADLVAGENADVHRRAPDAGLTGLGWLLLAHAAYTATMMIPGLVTDLHGELGRMFHLLGGAGDHSLWWNAGIAILEGLAGYELVRMTSRHRVIAMVYAVVAAGVTIYLFWPVLKHLDKLRMSRPQHLMTLMPIAIALVIPVSTLILVNRKIAPSARARFRVRT